MDSVSFSCCAQMVTLDLICLLDAMDALFSCSLCPPNVMIHTMTLFLLLGGYLKYVRLGTWNAK